jgi:hypothetical protein
MKTEACITVACHRCWQTILTRIPVGQDAELPAWYRAHGWRRIDGHLVCEECQRTEVAS